MMKTLVFEVILLWHVRKFQTWSTSCKMSGQTWCQRRPVPSVGLQPPAKYTQKNKFMLFSRWTPHTFSYILPRDALLFRSELAPSRAAKAIFVCKMWLRVDAEMCKTCPRSSLSACTRKEENCTDRLIEMYAVLKSEQIQTSWVSPCGNYSY